MLILGTVQFGLNYGINNQTGQTPEEEVFHILDYAFDHGIKYLDTAAAYGTSEKVLGKHFRQNKNKTFRVITKFDLRNNNSCEASLKRSLENLYIDNIDIILFHSFRDYKANRQEAIELVENFKGQKFRRIGVSVYTNEEIEELIDDEIVDVVQAPFNLIDNEQQRGDALRRLKAASKEVHTRSVFLQGLFFKPLKNFPQFLQPLTTPISPLKIIAEKNGLTLNQLAISYPLSKPYIDGVLIGVESLKQLKENLASIKNLPAKVEKSIDEIFITDNELLNPSKWVITR